jgi:hypothetical protein
VPTHSIGVKISPVGILELVIGFVLGLASGLIIEHSRAAHVRQARDEQQLRDWRRQGADAIGIAQVVLKLLRSELPDDEVPSPSKQLEQRRTLEEAQREWRAVDRALASLAAEHPDASVKEAVQQIQSMADEFFDAFDAAIALVPAAPMGPMHMRQQLEAMKDPEAHRYASAMEVTEAWANAEYLRDQARYATWRLEEVLNATVEDK